MKPLPRLLALTDDRVAVLDDLAQRAGAIAAVGAAAGLVARLPGGSTDALSVLATRFVALARPPMASVFVTGRVDVALACGADGVIARSGDLDPRSMREAVDRSALARRLVVVQSVHSVPEAEAAVASGVDGLLLGTIWETATHPGRTPSGPELIDRVARCGVPVWAVGGVTPEHAVEAFDAGAWGVAAISALWDASDVNRSALALLAPWRGNEER